MEYIPTIGLEIHAELKTQTKMFCDCRNDPDEDRPNVNVCSICIAHPGTLPVINETAVRHVLRVGSAIGGTLADFTEFDRKSYFYPDIPKGYQISQYEHPLVLGGSLAGVDITRIHLEEDTARSIHANGASLVDFNRAGIPLMELVTEPVIHDAATAGRFARELQLLLRTLGAGAANLEKGEMRVEANISVSRSTETLGTKVEVKNLNSFRSVERAIAYEIERHTALLERGETIVQATRGWDESKQSTFHQRFKEGSADYRYFPEPDLPKLHLSDKEEYTHVAIHASLPELPWDRRKRYVQKLELRDAESTFLCATPERSAFFDAVVSELGADTAHVCVAANYIVSDLAGLFAKRGTESYKDVSAKDFARLVRMIVERDVSSRGAKDILTIMVEQGGAPEEIARTKGLLQSHDVEHLRAIVKQVIEEESTAVREFRSGKEAALQYLIGKGMKAAQGAGNPSAIRQLIVEEV